MSRDSSQVSQNCDNFISSRSSTRLHAPPGGGSSMGSLIFGGGGDDQPQAVSRRRQIIKEDRPERAAPPVTAPEPSKQQDQGTTSFGKRSNQSSSNAYASGASQNTGNVLTDRRTTRIHAPPGGKSSFTLG